VCAAAALAERFDHVLVLERDALPATPQPRRGVPQSAQLHNLLAGAQAGLEVVLPGFCAELEAAGGVRARVSADTHVHELGIRMPERDLGLSLMCAPRPVIEHVARTMVGRLPGVEILQGAQATGVRIEAGSVRSVLATIGDDHRELPAEVVVDATGAAAESAEWLAAAGCPVAQQRRAVNQWYCTGVYASDDVPCPAQRFWLVFPTWPATRGGLISPLRGGRLHVSLNGRDDDPPPHTTAQFLDYARSLPDPVIADVIAGAVPLDEPRLFRVREAVWRACESRYSQVNGLLVIGDAVAVLNPLFGQGMSVAALQSAALAQCLADPSVAGIATLTERYQRRAAEVVSRAWELGDVIGSSHSWLRSLAEPSVAQGFGELLQRDAALHGRYVRIWHLLESTSALDDVVLTSAGITLPR
jgi:2-polyprenyl-6-methoxyphenol hydroxylase-like FAD-dependent oxidoreductase